MIGLVHQSSKAEQWRSSIEERHKQKYFLTIITLSVRIITFDILSFQSFIPIQILRSAMFNIQNSLTMNVKLCYFEKQFVLYVYRMKKRSYAIERCMRCNQRTVRFGACWKNGYGWYLIIFVVNWRVCCFLNRVTFIKLIYTVKKFSSV